MPRPAASPFLRWAGGKRSLLDLLTAAAPASYGRYFEPFVGGGAVFLALDSSRSGVINDVNPNLTATYTVVRDDVDGLIARLKDLGGDTSEATYLAVRAQDPAGLDLLGRAARFIYLNKLCFNGLYRENRSGRFNVPYGHITRPLVCDEVTLRAASARLAGTDIRCGGFAAAVADAQAGDWVYLDPPYIPLSTSSSFSSYAKDDFLEPDQRALSATIAELVARGVQVTLSNSDTPLTRDIYDALGANWELYSLQVRRSISAVASSRGRVGEVLGLSYRIEDCADPALVRARLGLQGAT